MPIRAPFSACSGVPQRTSVRPAAAVEQREAFDAGLLFARTEGLVPAPESCHAVAGAIAEARRRADTGEAGVLVVGLSGNGQLDLPAYAEHLTGVRTPATGDQPF